MSQPIDSAGGPRLSRPFDDRFVLRMPPVNASTARVYAEFRAEDCGKFHNDLQPAACRLYPAIAEAIAEMEAEGLEDVQMTGSGSAVYGAFRSETAAEKAKNALSGKYRDIFLCHTQADSIRVMEE